ncbi:hypothetical protein AL043_27640 [Pseudomonas amygdali pv. aesculi]|nr:hypothetical protein AL043_27640 [Pseudomonas amygdali pv. aesculi]KWT31987.1 hypothetical protein AL044_10025 [Pseudomonas amygdali pv. aesculi]KWT39051.1 hypothetical protein AL045_18835 [Pseudomonas amygdali pv. aesculi]
MGPLGLGTMSVGDIVAQVRVNGRLLPSVPVPCAATGSRFILLHPSPFGQLPLIATGAGTGFRLIPGPLELVLFTETPVCAQCV